MQKRDAPVYVKKPVFIFVIILYYIGLESVMRDSGSRTRTNDTRIMIPLL